MDQSQGAQFALHVALQTMKERCQTLQKRVSALEEENMTLKLKCATHDYKDNSCSEIDSLTSKIATLTEEKIQLRNNVAMVASENRQLWNRLSKLTQDNKLLGSKLDKISDSINQHTKNHTPLIRSKTFTQDAPHTKHLQKVLIENDKISLELEDISLKLISSISKEKTELEMQCNEMAQLQNSDILTNSFGFSYLDEEIEDSMTDEFEKHLIDMQYIKNALLLEREKLEKTVHNLQNIKVEKCEKCTETTQEIVTETFTIPNRSESVDDLDTKMQLDSLAKWGTPENSNVFLNTRLIMDYICPICSRRYSRDTNFDEFQAHVEFHFKTDVPENL